MWWLRTDSRFHAGRLMDFVLEDLDVMKKELQTWQSELTTHNAALSDESRYGTVVEQHQEGYSAVLLYFAHLYCCCSVTDNTLQPMRSKLRDVNAQISDRVRCVVCTYI